jgi:regulator of sigma E protease
MSIFAALLVLSFLIFFHELGHFMAARFFGVHVEVFSIGFGKRIWTKKLGATEFSLALIPLGGYVRMKGQDDSDPSKKSDDADSYNAKNPWQRIVILLAGPLANFLLAFILFYAIALVGQPTLGTKVYKTMPDSPAQKAGLLTGDIITTINGIDVKTHRAMSDIIKESSSAIDLIIDRNNTMKKITLIPTYIESENIFREKVKRLMIGISLDPRHRVTVDYGIISAISEAWYQTEKGAIFIFQSVSKLLTGAVPVKELGGVISIVDITAKAASENILYVLFITAFISINLGVMNLLPIPALDGGHIMFNLYEVITKKAPAENIMIKITIAGWILLLSLMALGIYNDITRIMQP